MPAARATPVDGGLRVSGRWSWGSGTQHCTWVGGGCLVVDEEGTPTPRGDGLATPYVFFPVDEIEFIDNWDVSGLSGTGSCDYQVTDVFVPEGRWVQNGVDEPVRHNSLSRFSFYGLLACGVGACALGIGRRAVAELVDLADTKKPQGSSRSLAHRSPVQADVAIAEAKLAAAWSFMNAAITSAWETAERDTSPTVEQKRQLRMSATHATQTAAEVAELMYKAGGGAAVYRTSALQRTFRDAFVATQHAMVAPRTFETYGRLRLGLETDTRLL
jgi:alkylation response protein AidB-like acyl-CoA dehydrogenase